AVDVRRRQEAHLATPIARPRAHGAGVRPPLARLVGSVPRSRDAVPPELPGVAPRGRREMDAAGAGGGAPMARWRRAWVTKSGASGQWEYLNSYRINAGPRRRSTIPANRA